MKKKTPIQMIDATAVIKFLIVQPAMNRFKCYLFYFNSLKSISVLDPLNSLSLYINPLLNDLNTKCLSYMV